VLPGIIAAASICLVMLQVQYYVLVLVCMQLLVLVLVLIMVGLLVLVLVLAMYPPGKCWLNTSETVVDHRGIVIQVS